MSQSSNHNRGDANNGSGNSSSNNDGNSATSSENSKKEEFRRYLDNQGVLDALTKVLVGLYEEPERPTQAIEYIKRYIGAPTNVDVEGLKRENEQLKAEVERWKKQAQQPAAAAPLSGSAAPPQRSSSAKSGIGSNNNSGKGGSS